MGGPQTMFDKIWERHVVVRRDDDMCLMYVDRHLLHDGSFHAFTYMRNEERELRRLGEHGPAPWLELPLLPLEPGPELVGALVGELTRQERR